MSTVDQSTENYVLALLKRRAMTLAELSNNNPNNSQVIETTMNDLEERGIVEKTDSSQVEWRLTHKDLEESSVDLVVKG